MDNEEILQRFGTPLEPLEEDQVVTKKPLHVQDQIVKDENGKRRFHGAFTGGFSAGFWNTVGSQEGWTPQSFKSSRSEKTEQRKQLRPEDFMDSEDLGEFGIAPQRLQIHQDFSNELEESRKRKHVAFNAGPIPGVPVLQQLLKPMGTKVSVRILKSMGWRPGQGVGPRLTRTGKRKVREHNMRELYLMEQYGYKLDEGKTANALESEEESDTDDEEEEITFAPDDFEPYLCIPRNNRYGLGYAGLSRETVLEKDVETAATSSTAQHLNLFQGLGKNNQTFSIRGQAFGVGALEEEDEDIYTHDDMSKYDFSLEKKKTKTKTTEKHVQDSNVIEGFALLKDNIQYKPPFVVKIPAGFRPRNWAERKSRFAPLAPEKAKQLSSYVDAQKRRLNPDKRGEILGEVSKSSTTTETNEPCQQQLQNSKSGETKEILESNSAKGNKEKLNELEANVKKENQALLEKVTEKSKLSASGVPSGTFKPFCADESKQKRYEQFLDANLHDEEAITNFLSDIQPVHLSEWDRQMEKKEFIQARKMYRPLHGIMSDRFVSEATIELKKAEDVGKTVAEKKIAAVRTRTMWKPCSTLCKRYNLAEPFGGTMVEEQQPKRAKLSVFDYIEVSVNTKANFHTPVIIPKHIEKPMPVVKQNEQHTESASVAKATEEIKKEIIDVKLALPAAASESSKSVKPVIRAAPKTDLEKRCEEMIDVPASEKLELFKAIFEDSDDSDAEEETAKGSATNETAGAAVGVPIISSVQSQSAAAANILRNTSPPKGIFAALFTKEVKQTEPTAEAKDIKTPAAKTDSSTISQTVESADKITFRSKKDRFTEEPNKSSEVDVYGPRLPDNLKKVTATPSKVQVETSHSDVDNKLLRLLEKQKPSKHIVEVWVEKSIVPDDSCSDNSSNSSSSSDNRKHKKKKKKLNKKSHKSHKKKAKKKSMKHEKSHKSKKSKHK